MKFFRGSYSVSSPIAVIMDRVSPIISEICQVGITVNQLSNIYFSSPLNSISPWDFFGDFKILNGHYKNYNFVELR